MPSPKRLIKISIMSPRLAGKVAIVTGAASGYGKGIAQKFLDEGAKVVIADLSEAAGQNTATELGCSSFRIDITQQSDWESLLKHTVDTYGTLDIIVNNAGTTYKNKPTEQATAADFDLVFNVNVRSIFLSTSTLVPWFLEQGKPASFINVASTAAIRPRPNLTWYNASKAAVSNATKTMAVEYAARGLRFNTVCPGVGQTGLYVWSMVCRAQPLLRDANSCHAGRVFLLVATPTT